MHTVTESIYSMRHFLATEFSKLIADPIMRAKISVECGENEHN